MFTPLESAVMHKFFEGSTDEDFTVLKQQFIASKVASRELTGVGFFTDFYVPEDIPRIKNRSRLVLGSVQAEIKPLKHGAGFIVFVENGALKMLEGYSYDEAWPDDSNDFTLWVLDKITLK